MVVLGQRAAGPGRDAETAEFSTRHPLPSPPATPESESLARSAERTVRAVTLHLFLVWATSTRGYLMSLSFVLRGVVYVSVFRRLRDPFAFGSGSQSIVLTVVMSTQTVGITSSSSHMRTLASVHRSHAAGVFSLFPSFPHRPHDSAAPQCKAIFRKVRPRILCTIGIN